MSSNIPAGPLLYVVACRFAEGANDVATQWLKWICEKHLSEVLQSGALSAEVLQDSSSANQFEIHYRFASAADFARYERDHALRLRADGLTRFPLSLGLEYQRRVAEQIAFRIEAE